MQTLQLWRQGCWLAALSRVAGAEGHTLCVMQWWLVYCCLQPFDPSLEHTQVCRPTVTWRTVRQGALSDLLCTCGVVHWDRFSLDSATALLTQILQVVGAGMSCSCFEQGSWSEVHTLRVMQCARYCVAGSHTV